MYPIYYQSAFKFNIDFSLSFFKALKEGILKGGSHSRASVETFSDISHVIHDVEINLSVRTLHALLLVFVVDAGDIRVNR
jgi:hypothetical protein